MKTRLGYIASFLAGVVVAVVGTALVGGDDELPLLSQSERVSSPDPAPAAVGETRKDLTVEDPRSDLPSDFACRPRPGESPSQEFQRLLRELVQAPAEEREFRLGLLLARLRENGATSIPVILDYLRTGRDLPAQSIFGEGALFGGGDYYRNMRMLLFLALAQIGEGQPELRTRIANEGLEQARDLGEALTLVDLAKADPGTRRLALDAITRLFTEQDGYYRFYATTGAAVRLHGEELIPILSKVIEAKPFHHYIDAYLAALWNFPDATRVELSKRLVASEAVRKVMQHSPESWLWLDAREPELRTAIVQDFQASGTDEHRINLLRNLAQDRKNSQSRFHQGFPIGNTPASAGAPDSKAQNLARLALLDDLAPFCRTPQLRVHWEEARTQLVSRVAEP